MAKGVDFLRRVKQDYIQYDVLWPVNISYTAYHFRDNGVPENEFMMIYKGWSPTIEISSAMEYERFKVVNCDSDYRAYENGVLFCTNDMNEINKVIEAVETNSGSKQYVELIDGLMNAFEPQMKLEKK